MAKAIDIKGPAPFDAHSEPSKSGTLWKKWTKSFEIYVSAAGIDNDVQKRNLLLHNAGLEVQEIFETLVAETGTTYAQAKTALDAHFTPKVNKWYERHIFRNRGQNENETIGQYVTQLRVLAGTCEFTATDEEIIAQVIEKCTSKKLRKSLLKDENLDITRLLAAAQLHESVSHQSKDYEKAKKNHHDHEERVESDSQ